MKMKTITRKIKVYEYDELSGDSQDKAVTDYINFIIEVIPYEELSESMQTPWFVGSYIWEYAKDEILENVREYPYLKNGDIFNK